MGRPDLNQSNHAQPPVQSMANQLNHAQPPVQSMANQPKHAQPPVQSTANQLNHAQPPVQSTANQPKHAQPPVQSTANQLKHAQPPVQSMADQPNHAQPPVQSTANQPNHAQPPVQSTANQVPSQHGANGNQARIATGIPVNNQTQNRWSSDLFDCMNDSENAVITFIAPCVTFGQIAEIVDEGATTCPTGGLLYATIFLIGAPFVYSCMFRAKLRSKYGLPDAPAPDWLTHLFCEYCALCQEYRELKHRGFDPNIGWAGNVQPQQQDMMAPPTGQRMMG